MSTYKLIVQNHSSLEGDVCVYQTAPDVAGSNVQSLAWVTAYAHPTTAITFTWSPDDYCFVWQETSKVSSGITVAASQTWQADLTGQNQVTLTYRNGGFTFENLQAGPTSGSLSIMQDASIPVNTASVGIGMAGAPTFMCQAMPNMNVTFTPQPAYWVAFGSFTQGQALNVTEITNPAQITFPPNVYTMSVTLNPDNTWTITPDQM